MSLCEICSSDSRAKNGIEGLDEGEVCEECGFDPEEESLAEKVGGKSRVAKVVIGRDLKPDVLFKEDYNVVEGLPDDAEFVNFKHHPIADAYVFLFKSKEFELIDDLAALYEIPEVTIEIDEVLEE